MKRAWVMFLSVLVVFTLSACTQSDTRQMYIEQAQLTNQEQNIADLLGVNQDFHLYDFKLDDTVKSIQINTYELTDGKWHQVTGGGGLAFEDSSGRFMLSFNNLSEGLRFAIQSEHNNNSTSYFKENTSDVEGMSYTTSTLSDKTEVMYEQEIPLAIQIITSKNEVHSYVVDYYFQPEEYEKYNYEHVYAVTVLFSQKTVSELETNSND